MKKAYFFGLLIVVITFIGCGKKTIIVGKICEIKQEATIECDPQEKHQVRVMSIVFEDRPAIHTKRENFYPDMLKLIGKKVKITLHKNWARGYGRKDYHQEILSIIKE